MCVSHKLLGKLFPMSGRRQRHSWGRCRGHSSPYLRGHLKGSPRKQTPCYHMPQKHHLGDWKCPSQGWVNFQHQMGVGGASEDKDEMGVGASEAWAWPFRRGHRLMTSSPETCHRWIYYPWTQVVLLAIWLGPTTSPLWTTALRVK